MEESFIVSVIIPVYNAEKYLHECLNSLLLQTLREFEIICVDDGSSDSSLSILKEFASKDPRIKVLTQEHAFAGAARNLGIQQARGKYLLFLDADDRFKPQMLETAVRQAEKQNADICVFGAEGFDHSSGKVYPMPWVCQPSAAWGDLFSANEVPDQIFSFTNPAPWNKLFLRKFVSEKELEFQKTRSANDLAFVMTALAEASRIATAEQVLMQYRYNNAASLQGSQEKVPLAFYDALLELRKRLKERGLYSKLERAYVNRAAADTFYNLHTLKTTVAFENTYFFIRNTILEELTISGRDKDYFFVLPDWHLPERIRVMQEESILDYAEKFRVALPDLQKQALRDLTVKDLVKLIYLWVRQKFS